MADSAEAAPFRADDIAIHPFLSDESLHASFGSGIDAIAQGAW